MKNWFGILCVVFFLLNGRTNAQFYALSNKPQLTQKKHFYHTVVGENQLGLYTVNYTNDYFAGGFSLEHYDRELGFQDDRVFNLPKQAYILDMFLADTQIFWVSVIRKRREPLRLYLNQIGVGLDGAVVSNFLGYLPVKHWNPDDIKFAYSKENGQWAVSVLSDVGGNKTALWVQVRDLNGSLQRQYLDTLDERLALVAFTHFGLGASKEVLGLLRVLKPRSVFNSQQKEQQVFVFRGSEVESGFREWRLAAQVQSVEMIYDAFLSRWLLCALVGEGQRESNGYSLWWLVDTQTGYQQYDGFFTDMQAKILDGDMRAKKRRNPMNYVIRRVVPQQDGGGVLLLERYIELKQLETFYINGIPQTATKVLYNYNEIGALFFDSSGICDTILRVNKEQTAAPATAYLLGFGSFVCENGIHLVYNDDISKNNEIKEVILRPDYAIEEHLLLNSDNFYNVVVPFDGIESEYCTFTLPLLRDKQWFWMQVKNRD